MAKSSRIVLIIVVVALALGLLMVLIGNIAVARTNPPVTYTIQWSSPETEQLARAACFDCHSNETKWPWYAYVAPMAFFINNHVTEGRAHLNFSTGESLDGEEMVEQIQKGAMPLPNYLIMHPEARLTPEQQEMLMRGLRDTFPEGSGRESGDENESGESEDENESDDTPQTTPEARG